MLDTIPDLPVLYKTGSRSQEVQWCIWVTREPHGASYHTEHGQIGGRLQTTSVKVTNGKNVGRKNETTPVQQAVLEASSKWQKQKDKGYSEERGGSDMSLKPMMAQDFKKHRDKVVYPCFVQPKFNGMRCLARKHGGAVLLTSRGGKPITTMPHIVDALTDRLQEGDHLDGELYLHDGTPLQTILSWCRGQHPEHAAKIQYHVYDAVMEEPFSLRYGRVKGLIGYGLGNIVVAAPTFLAQNEEFVAATYSGLVGDGYEGAMVRHGESPYKAGYRSRDLLKYKEFKSEEFKIVGVEEGKGKFEGMAIFECATTHGARFKCMPKGTDAVRRDYWTGRAAYIGRQLTVQFFDWTASAQPVPQFPVGVAIREKGE